MCIIGHVSLVLTGLQEFSYVSSEYLGSDALIRVGGLMQRTMREGFVKIGAFFLQEIKSLHFRGDQKLAKQIVNPPKRWAALTHRYS